jgi:GT2 family glycosyltransferase
LKGIMMTTPPQVTIVVVPRDRFSHSERSLQNLYENTTLPFELVYVGAGVPERLRRYLDAEVERKKFRLLHVDRYLSPNQARNLGLREAGTKYVVFLDNDALVAPRWLEALVRCAEETGAWVTGPLYLYGEFERAVIHMAGGALRLAVQEDRRLFIDEQYLFDTALTAAPLPLSRRRCDYAEFHCMLVRAEAFERLGEFDEKLLSLHEERDFCLAVGRAGGSVWIEPKAMVTFVPPPPCDWSDVPYFMLRWSDGWNLASVRHFNEKWGVDAVRHVNDQTLFDEEGSIIGFGRSWRRHLAGIKIGGDNGTEGPRSPLEQAEVMIASFQAVDRDCFDLVVTNAEGRRIDSALSLAPDAILDRLPGAVGKADEEGLNLMIRLVEPTRPHHPHVIRLDDLTAEQLPLVRSCAFMTLETRPGRFQCWIAIDKNTWRNTAALYDRAPAAAEPSLNDFALIAGNAVRDERIPDHAGRYPRVRFVEGVVGQLAGPKQLRRPEIQALLASGRVC